jgi:hypothetical protein
LRATWRSFFTYSTPASAAASAAELLLAFASDASVSGIDMAATMPIATRMPTVSRESAAAPRSPC